MTNQPTLRIGVRFEFYTAHGGSPLDGPVESGASLFLCAALVREDLVAAAVPSPGDLIGQHTFRGPIHGLIGGSPEVSHVEHYLREPHEAADREPLPVVVCKVAASSRFAGRWAEAADQLRDQGWTVYDFADQRQSTFSPRTASEQR